MSPELRAKDLLQKFTSINSWVGGEGYISLGHENGKKAALLAVNEIIEANPYYFYPGRKVMRIEDHSTKEYWEAVKQSLENL